MTFKILGSGGCVATPKPLCQCHVCTTARQKGFPYARCGASLYLQEAALVVDTPEDITQAINNANILKVDHIMYSHWDPDHTLGMRVLEQLRLEWLDHYAGEPKAPPIHVYANPLTMKDLMAIQNKFGSFLGFYEHMGLAKTQVVEESIHIAGIKITLVPVPANPAVSVFVFEQDGKKLIYAPCDCSPLDTDQPLFHHADVLIVGETLVTDIGKGGRKTAPPNQDFHTLGDISAMKWEMNIGRIIITHIEELYGKTHDQLMEMQQYFDGIAFAHDGMEISL